MIKAIRSLAGVRSGERFDRPISASLLAVGEGEMDREKEWTKANLVVRSDSRKGGRIWVRSGEQWTAAVVVDGVGAPVEIR